LAGAPFRSVRNTFDRADEEMIKVPQVNGDCGSPSGVPLRPCGVWGDCLDNPGVIGTSLRRGGVRGETRDRYGVYGSSERSSGVLGYGLRFGVAGICSGQGSDTDPTVYAGVYGYGNDIGVFTEGVFGIVSRSTAGAGGSAGIFEGNVHIDGSLTVNGPLAVLPGNTKSAAVLHPDGTLRQLYALESPESWFEDFGRGEVTQGRARISLDEDFLTLIDTDDYHVFLTPEAESNGLYVSARTPQQFEVREQGDAAGSVPFSYRVVARRKDVPATRLGRVEEPRLPTATEVVRPDLEDGVVWDQET
jgi:hypothetical protein